MFCSFSNRRIASAVDYASYHFIYEKYGNAIYGIALKICEGDENKAGLLLNNVLVEAFIEKHIHIETTDRQFPLLLKIIVIVSRRHGYTDAAIIRAIAQYPVSVFKSAEQNSSTTIITFV